MSVFERLLLPSFYYVVVFCIEYYSNIRSLQVKLSKESNSVETVSAFYDLLFALLNFSIAIENPRHCCRLVLGATNSPLTSYWVQNPYCLRKGCRITNSSVISLTQPPLVGFLAKSIQYWRELERGRSCCTFLSLNEGEAFRICAKRVLIYVTLSSFYVLTYRSEKLTEF